ncbi:MAG TPA: sulfotransferase [Candidatus Sulfopaludibacter sp.]|nr:sulfotransferase [Candidatus Sulfopaludibacter sp.]
MKLKRPPLVPQNSVVRLFQAAEQALQSKDFEQNFELLERARRLDPANPTLLLQLGRNQGLRYNYAAAGEYFEKAVQLSSRKTETLAMAALQSRDFFNPELSERFFRRAAEQKDVKPATLVFLAELYERLHRPDEVAQLIDRALQMDRSFAPALLVRARLEQQTGHWEAAEKRLRELLPKADRETRVSANYQLGAVLDRQGRYDEAMSAFLEAKKPLQAGHYFLQRQVLNAHLREMLTSLSADVFQRWFEFGRELEPRKLSGPALLCGHIRSGTTLLEQVLDAHPGIISAEETPIFYDDVYVPLVRARPAKAPRPDLPRHFQVVIPVELPVLEEASRELLRQVRENYFRMMELCLGEPIGGRLLIDKNPALIHLLFGFHRVFPEMKLIVTLRDPRDICLSCFMQNFAPIKLKHTAYFNLEDTVEEYVQEMNIWRAIAPMLSGRYLEVRYEDIVEDLESVARKTLDYLGTPWDARVLRFHEHARQKLVRTPTFADVTKPIFKTARGRWHNYQKYFEPHLHRLEPFVKAFGYE